MDPYAPSGEAKPAAVHCSVCDTEIPENMDFCMECGHSVGWGASGGSDPMAGEDADLAECSSCHAGLIRPQSGGHAQCENCGFMPREWSEE